MTNLIRKPYSASSIWQSNYTQVFIYLAVLGAGAILAHTGASRMGYNWQWYNIPSYILQQTDEGFQAGELLIGLGATVLISVIAFGLATLFGIVLAVLRLSDLIVGRAVSVILLEFLRNIPLLVLIYLFYYVLGPVLGWDRTVSGVLCLAIFHGALVSEIFRGGIKSVSIGQWEGAFSVGLTRAQAYRYVVLPQAFRIMLPPLTGEAIHLIKSSAIVSVIGVAELTTRGRDAISESYMSFEIWFTVALLYLVLTVFLSAAAQILERRIQATSTS